MDGTGSALPIQVMLRLSPGQPSWLRPISSSVGETTDGVTNVYFTMIALAAKRKIVIIIIFLDLMHDNE